MARKPTRRMTRKRRGGGLGDTSASWAPDNSAFGRFAGSPLNADNLEFEKSPKGGAKRRKTKKMRRSRRGGDPIPDRNQFEARPYEVKKKQDYPAHKVEIKMGQYDSYKNKAFLKK